MGWIEAFRRSGAATLWLMLWNFVGGVLIAIGIYIAFDGFSDFGDFSARNIALALPFFIAGYLIILLAGFATFLRSVTGSLIDHLPAGSQSGGGPARRSPAAPEDEWQPSPSLTGASGGTSTPGAR
jgi:hypothetical protein